MVVVLLLPGCRYLHRPPAIVWQGLCISGNKPKKEVTEMKREDKIEMWATTFIETPYCDSEVFHYCLRAVEKDGRVINPYLEECREERDKFLKKHRGRSNTHSGG